MRVRWSMHSALSLQNGGLGNKVGHITCTGQEECTQAECANHRFDEMLNYRFIYDCGSFDKFGY